MPTYSYMCEDCGYEFEQFQSINSRPLRKCPSCSRRGLKRLIGAGAGIIFRGSGFYETDYRSESYKKAAEKEKGGTEKDKSKKESKSESNATESTKKAEKSTSEKKKSA
jgi:putative FmdB family regulatory protein